MKTLLFFNFGLFLINSCQSPVKNNIKKEVNLYFNCDTDYYRNGIIESILISDNKRTIVYKTFDSTGRLNYEKNFDSAGHCHWAKMYTKEYLRVREFLELDDTSKDYIINREIYLNYSGDTLMNLSNFFDLKFLKDMYKANDTIKPKFYLTAPYFKQNTLPTYSVYIKIDNDTNYYRRKDFIRKEVPFDINLGVIPKGKYDVYISIEERKNLFKKNNQDSVREYIINRTITVR